MEAIRRWWSPPCAVHVDPLAEGWVQLRAEVLRPMCRRWGGVLDVVMKEGENSTYLVVPL